jgi:dTDP-4-amino-4,6-dideoxygalactose transaminase
MTKEVGRYLAFGMPDFSDEEIAAVARVLRSGWVGMGPETIAFERELAAFVGAEHVVAVNSCTSALFAVLAVLNIGPGDEVVVPSLTWCSTANAVLYRGATPVFCDVDSDTMSATPAAVAAALTDKTKAVVHVHFGGLAADMELLRNVVPENVAIIEDAAHALGAIYPGGDPVGSSGNLTCFSFYANKNLSTADGGAVAVRDAPLAEAVRQLTQQGLQSDAWKRFSHPMAALTPAIAGLGYKMNFTDLQASIGRVQLRRQAEFEERRKRIARIYRQRLSGDGTDIRFQSGLDAPGHARHLFVVRVPLGRMTIGRDELLLELRARNIGASIHYAPLHTLPLYRPYLRGTLPVTEEIMHDILTLPIGPRMTDDDAARVAEEFLALLDKARRPQ